MAVPKKKISRSRTRQRRSHLALRRANIIQDKHTGEFALSHHVTPEEKYYKGRNVIKEDTGTDNQESSEN
ncbi:50S ribosomal protein L32 [Rickettsiales bacterium]|nr:50S ribosomal protein L32 [Rickettsiales bacterium]